MQNKEYLTDVGFCCVSNLFLDILLKTARLCDCSRPVLISVVASAFSEHLSEKWISILPKSHDGKWQPTLHFVNPKRSIQITHILHTYFCEFFEMMPWWYYCWRWLIMTDHKTRCGKIYLRYNQLGMFPEWVIPLLSRVISERFHDGSSHSMALYKRNVLSKFVVRKCNIKLFDITWIMCLHYLIKLSIRVLQVNSS